MSGIVVRILVAVAAARGLNSAARNINGSLSGRRETGTDACAVAYLCHPEIFVEKQCHVDIELEGSLTAGTTVCDPGNYEGKEKNATVLYGVDREKFAELFIEAMSKLDK